MLGASPGSRKKNGIAGVISVVISPCPAALSRSPYAAREASACSACCGVVVWMSAQVPY